MSYILNRSTPGTIFRGSNSHTSRLTLRRLLSLRTSSHRPPNILILMVDQANGTLFPDGPASLLHAPHLSRLAERSVRFANTYTPSPLCAPGRASFMSGLLPNRTRVYDNAAEFASGKRGTSSLRWYEYMLQLGLIESGKNQAKKAGIQAIRFILLAQFYRLQTSGSVPAIFGFV